MTWHWLVGTACKGNTNCSLSISRNICFCPWWRKFSTLKPLSHPPAPPPPPSPSFPLLPPPLPHRLSSDYLVNSFFINYVFRTVPAVSKYRYFFGTFLHYFEYQSNKFHSIKCNGFELVIHTFLVNLSFTVSYCVILRISRCVIHGFLLRPWMLRTKINCRFFLSFRTSKPKKSVKVQWRAPSDFQGSIIFRYIQNFLKWRAVLRIRIRDPVLFWSLYPGWGKKSGSRIRDEHPRSFFR